MRWKKDDGLTDDFGRMMTPRDGRAMREEWSVRRIDIVLEAGYI